MHIESCVGTLETQTTGALLVTLFEGATALEGMPQTLDRALNGQLQALLANGDFRGKRNEVAVLYPQGMIPAQRVIVVGLGKPEKFTVDGVRQAAATAAVKARELGGIQMATMVHGADSLGMERAAQAVVEGTLLGLYRFRELKTQNGDIRPDVESLTLVVSDAAQLPAMAAGARAGQIIAEATCLARDLVNRPGNVATPTHLAEQALALTALGLSVRVLEEADMAALNMGALLGVARGTAEPAKFIIIEHNAGRADLPTIVLVGKGLTFDSGGISIKPSEGMEAMKNDMGGGAAVLGTLRAVAQLNLPLHVVGLVPATENMPGGRAYKPGDVLRSRKGLTIEVISTDAEGRLILADALTYAGEFKPQAIVDLATLTGACVVALGSQAAGVMGNDGLVTRLRRAGDETGERVWPLPLYEEYAEQIKSDTADLKNTGGRPAGALTAGIFLSKFVPEGVAWAHVDMAGLATEDKGRPYVPKGGSGYGVRLLVEMLRAWGNGQNRTGES